jgi:hypothetical protein
MILLTKPFTPIAFTGVSKTFNVYGRSFFNITNVYLSGNPYRNTTFFNPFSAVPKLSALYPGITGIRLLPTQYTTNNNNTLTITVPSAVRTGYIDIIVENPAGYGILTQYVIKDLYSNTQTLQELRPWSSGILVLTGEKVFTPVLTINGDELITIEGEQIVTIQSY